ncbi:ADP-ribosylation factor-binding protein GGA3 [Armadillidium vulgare]|nr:ADP-ribosylation factor-binding protein GGA3 [Armadillidium vulgare]
MKCFENARTIPGSIPLNSSGSDSDLKNASGSKSESIMDELVGVFSSEVIIEKPTTNKPIMPKPISPLVRDHLNLQSHEMKPLKIEESPKPLLNDLDLLGSNLLRESLPSNIDPIGSQFRLQEKVSLNEMKQKAVLDSSAKNTDFLVSSQDGSRSSFESSLSPSVSKIDLISNIGVSPGNFSQLNNEEIKTKISRSSSSSSSSNEKSSEPSNISQDFSSLSLLLNEEKLNSNTEKSKLLSNIQLCEVKPLNNINVTLEEIKPGKQSSLSLMESNGLSVILHFTDNKPREDVSIIVVSVTSRNPRPVSNYVLQAVGPKGCKVRLQPPSSTTLAEYSPFLPPPAITQIMLIANPNQAISVRTP